MKIEIKHRYTGNVICGFESENIRDCLGKAVKENLDLSDAYLRGADLIGADLSDAYLRGAYLRGAYLRGAYLRGANLSDAYLRGADLRGADLSDAYLRGADLYGADLRNADLRGEKIAIAPILIGGLNWHICISESFMEIGCQRHKHSEWAKFDDEAIKEMHREALEFWKLHGKWLLASCKAHRKQSLAFRKANPESENE